MIALALVAGINKGNFANLGASGFQNHSFYQKHFTKTSIICPIEASFQSAVAESWFSCTFRSSNLGSVSSMSVAKLIHSS